MDSVSNKHPSSGRLRAILRLVLGQCQVIGAAATLVLLLQHGPIDLVLWLAGITGLVTITSIVLFRLIWPEKKREN
jgi:hypothetical protein